MVTGAEVTLLLGGVLSPLGSTVAFIQGSRSDVLSRLLTWRTELGQQTSVSQTATLRDGLRLLDPMQSPWQVELLVECGYGTAYLNNSIGGGDPTAAAPYLGHALDVRVITAQHMPRHGPGHAATQLWIQGPDGEPPLMYERTLAAHATDGQWIWHESGAVQPWERPDRYTARRKRDRLDRDLLAEYLSAIGIDVDDPAFYGRGSAVRRHGSYRSRTMSVSEWCADVGWGEM